MSIVSEPEMARGEPESGKPRALLMGQFAFVPDVDVHDLPAKARAVLAYLAANPGKPILRSRIADLVWSRSAPEQGRQSLRQAAAAIRTALSGSGIELLADQTAGTLRLVGATADISELETLSAVVAPGNTEQIKRLYRGVFLDEFPGVSEPFEDWIVAERARLAGLAGDCLARLAGAALERADTGEAIAAARYFVQLEPMREDAHRLLMRAFSAAGRSSEALQQYEECARLLKSELGVAPDAETQALARSIKSAALPSRHEVALANGPRTAVEPTAAPLPEARPEAEHRAVPRRMLWLAMAAVAALIVLAIGYQVLWRSLTSQLPTYAVKPFTVTTGGPAGKALASALSTRLANGISAIPNVRLIAAKGEDLPATDYVIEGNVAPGEQNTQVEARIIHVNTGEVFGKTTFKAPAGEDTAVQTLVLGRIGDDLSVAINRRIYMPPLQAPENKKARQLVQEARMRVDRRSADAYATLDLYRQALRLAPDDFEIASWFANALIAEASSGRPTDRDREALFREAGELIEDTLKKAPYHRLALYARCQLLRITNKPHAAFAACQETSLVLPWSSRTHKEVGFLRLSLGDMDAAIQAFTAADSLEKQYTVRWIWKYGHALALAILDRNAEARRLMEEAITLHEESYKAQLVLAVACQRLGDAACVTKSMTEFRTQTRQLVPARILDDIVPETTFSNSDIEAKAKRLKGEANTLLAQFP